MPIYVHPSKPHPAVIETYYKDYVEAFPQITNAAWGFTVETATQGMRLVPRGALLLLLPLAFITENREVRWNGEFVFALA